MNDFRSIVRTLFRRIRTAAELVFSGKWGLLRDKWEIRRWMNDLDRYGVNLDYTGHEELGFSPEVGFVHSMTPGPNLEKALKAIGIPAGAKVLDMGCGKAGALITFVKFPFSRIAGCDISAEMIQIARDNLNKLGIHGVDLYCADAATFTDLDDFDFFFMFNPLPRKAFGQFMDNLDSSLKRRPRGLTLIYRNPAMHDVVVAGSVFDKVQELHYGTQPFFVYVNRSQHDRLETAGQRHVE